MYNKPVQRDQYRNNVNSGALFNRNKKTNNSPDMGGDVTLDRRMVDYLVKCLEDGIEPKLELSAWRKGARGGSSYLSLSVAVPYSLREQNQQGVVRNDPRGIPDRNVHGSDPYRQAPNRYADQKSAGYDRGPQYRNQNDKDELPWD